MGNAGPTDQLAEGRYAMLVDKNFTEEVDPLTIARAWQQFEEKMALVPTGQTMFQSTPSQPGGVDGMAEDSCQLINVSAFYMDRYAVTNRDFARFVASDVYRDMQSWPKQIWSKLMQFVDQTGKPGPRFWCNGRPPAETLDHPVVGISWYEADAYARWSGKQLPNSAQWQHAGTWAGDPESNVPLARYPWGTGFCAKRANIYATGLGKTVPVDQFYDGCTVNGIYQLVGNVWEWTSTLFDFSKAGEGCEVLGEFGEIRGGAFDTYFESQASCLFRSGQGLLQRTANVGFRCCKPVNQTIPMN